MENHILKFQTGGWLKLCINLDVLEHFINIYMSNIDVANFFNAHHNLVSRHKGNHGLNNMLNEREDDNEIINTLREVYDAHIN